MFFMTSVFFPGLTSRTLRIETIFQNIKCFQIFRKIYVIIRKSILLWFQINYCLRLALDDFFEEGNHRMAVKSSSRVKNLRYCLVLAFTLIRVLPLIICCKQSSAMNDRPKLRLIDEYIPRIYLLIFEFAFVLQQKIQ